MQFWEVAKKKLKKFFIEKGIEKKRKQVDNEGKLALQLQSIHQLNLSTEQKKRKLAEIKFKLNQIQQTRINGAKIRSKILQINSEEEQQTNFYKAEEKQIKSNQISSLYNSNQTTVDSKEEVIEEVHSFYLNLWGTKKQINNQQQQHYINDVIDEPTAETRRSYILSKEEILDSIKNQNRNSSPGTDGLSAGFYNWAWDVIQDDLHEMFNNCFLKGEMAPSMKKAVVTLLPKKCDLKAMKNWRPVSLLNSDYKILAKAVTERLQEGVTNKISTEQKCAIKNRSMSDIHLNITTALKKMKNKRKKSAVLTCYNFRKAFDMVNHSLISIL